MSSVSAVSERAQLTERAPSHERRNLAFALFLIGCVALAIAWLGNPRAASFSDSGGRLATVKTMAEADSWVPDLGYWAVSVDPDGGNHPILFAKPYDHRFVQVTSVPLVVAGRPLWELGGARAVVLIPVLSVVLAAYAARRLSRWASGGDGWLALWFVGLLSPVLFYGADFWEHAPALALGLLAIAVIFEGGRRRVLVGGLLAAVAIVMRNDILVTFVTLGTAAFVVSEERRRSLTRWRELALGAGACAVAVAANGLIERALFSSTSGSVRAADRAQVAGLLLAERARDAVITTVGVFANEYWLALLIGAAIAAGILLMAAAAASSSGTSMTGIVGAVVAWGGMAWRLTFGISSVPGFLTAAPIAALGLFGKRVSREQVLFGGAVSAIPLIWLTQWVGDHSPQWGGRYVLLPTALLVVLAAGQVRRIGPTPLIVALVGLSAVMSALGVVWHVSRTHGIARFANDVLAIPEDVVVVSDSPYLATEIGSWYGDRRWLTAGVTDRTANDAEMEAVVRVAGEIGAERIDVIDSDDDPVERISEHPAYPGYRFESARTVDFLWDQFVIRRYAAT